jgi:two-component system cell cycle response regulator
MSARILVVDDHPLNVKLLAAKLGHDYYIVMTADNGTDALVKVKTEKPDLVLLDVMMPDMNGFDVCKLIKSDPETAHIPVVMVTALSDASDRVKGLEAGADDFLTKPINDVALMSRVRSLLRLRSIMDEWRLREATYNQFVQTPVEDFRPVMITGGSAVLLEDSQLDRATIFRTLGSMQVQVTFTSTIEETANFAQSQPCDLAIASLDLADEDGLLICSQLRTRDITRQLPILLLANESEISRVAKGLDLGATDYLLRPIDANELLARVRTQIAHKRNYERLRQNYEQSLALALVDPLTGAFNRRYLEAHVPKLFMRSQMAQKPISVLIVDIDHFKKVNDTHGHAAGDAVLREIVNRLTRGLRPSDLVARLGGEEFAIIMPEADALSSLAIAERLRKTIESVPIEGADQAPPLTVTVSIGIAVMLENTNEDPRAVFRRADQALYDAKKNGRNRVVVASNA